MDLLAIFSVIFLSLLLAMAGASAGLKAALYLIESGGRRSGSRSN